AGRGLRRRRRAPARRRADRAQRREDPRDDRQRPRDPRPARRRRPRRARVVLAPRTHPGPAHDGRGPHDDPRVRRARARAASTRLQVRRPDHGLRSHGGRRDRRHAPCGQPSPGRLRGVARVRELATTGPLPAAPMLAAPAAHSPPALPETSGAPVRSLLEVDGTVVPVEIEITDGYVAWRPPAGFPDATLARVEHTLRRWLDLDRDLAPVHAHLAVDPRLAPLVERWPGLRVVGHPDPFEAAVTTVLGQRVSLAAARVLAARFCEYFSGPPGT